MQPVLPRRSLVTGIAAVAILPALPPAPSLDSAYKAYLRERGMVFDPNSFRVRAIERGVSIQFLADPGGGYDHAAEIASHAEWCLFQEDGG